KADVDAFFEKRIKPDKHEAAKAHRDDIATSDTSNWKPGGFITFEDDDYPTVEEAMEDIMRETNRHAVEFAEKIVTNLPTPVINVHVDAKPGPTKNTVVRDE